MATLPTLTPNEQKIILLGVLCSESPAKVKIDYAKLAEKAGLKNASSAAVTYGKAKRKLFGSIEQDIAEAAGHSNANKVNDSKIDNTVKSFSVKKVAGEHRVNKRAAKPTGAKAKGRARALATAVAATVADTADAHAISDSGDELKPKLSLGTNVKTESNEDSDAEIQTDTNSSNGSSKIMQEFGWEADFAGGVFRSSRYPQELAEWDTWSQGFWTETSYKSPPSEWLSEWSSSPSPSPLQ